MGINFLIIKKQTTLQCLLREVSPHSLKEQLHFHYDMQAV